MCMYKMDDGFYMLQGRHDSYDIHVINYSDIGEVKIQVGKVQDPKGPCVEINIHLTTKTAQLESAQYHEKCNTKENMRNGAGTIQMLETIFACVFQSYPHIRSISFNDVSQIPLPNGRSVNLMHYYMLTYGQTWYQRHVYAVPTTKTKAHLVAWKRVLETAPLKVMTFKRFWKHVLVSGFRQRWFSTKGSLETVFNNSSSFTHMFKHLRESYQDHLFDMFETIQQNFILQTGLPSLLYSEWKIRRSISDAETGTGTIKITHQLGGFQKAWAHRMKVYAGRMCLVKHDHERP